ncbi:MAG: 50S ribosomal protein L29 [Planctomycetota bacterium]|jgi:large subunit ribosomal protein L29|nr:50S ribosomal protein L29 [Planctomycetota bacterium]
MKAVEMRGMEPAALAAEIEKLRRELLELRCKVALGEDVRPHRVKEIRREIARMLTVAGGKKEEGVKA